MIALLGGTFDPVHLGHLHAARCVADRLGVAQVRLVLSARPGHRGAPGANSADRWAMLQLAVADEPRLVADDSELRRDGPSYTVDTLEALRRRFGKRLPLVWILGWDAYRLLPTWHRWQAVLGLTHLVVVRRPGQDIELDDVMADFTTRHEVDSVAPLRGQPAGHVLRLVEAMLSISSTAIRGRIATGAAVRDLLPAAVWTYINERHLYGASTA